MSIASKKNIFKTNRAHFRSYVSACIFDSVFVYFMTAVPVKLKFHFFRGERKCTRDVNNNIVVGYNLSALPGGKYFIELEVHFIRYLLSLLKKYTEKAIR